MQRPRALVSSPTRDSWDSTQRQWAIYPETETVGNPHASALIGPQMDPPVASKSVSVRLLIHPFRGFLVGDIHIIDAPLASTSVSVRLQMCMSPTKNPRKGWIRSQVAGLGLLHLYMSFSSLVCRVIDCASSSDAVSLSTSNSRTLSLPRISPTPSSIDDASCHSAHIHKITSVDRRHTTKRRQFSRERQRTHTAADEFSHL